LPVGIDKTKGLIKDRKKEMDVLLSNELRDAMPIRGISRFEFPNKPVIEDHID
jgi:SAM-dependent MidA family methyltransferase